MPQVLSSFQSGEECGLSTISDSVCLSIDSGMTERYLSAPKRAMGLTGKRDSRMPFLWTQAPRVPGVPACLELARRPRVPVESATPLEMQPRL